MQFCRECTTVFPPPRPRRPDQERPLQPICLAILTGLLIWIANEDMRRFQVPDRASLPLIAAGLACAYLEDTLPLAALGAATGLLLFAALAHGYRRIRGRDGLGFGDAKLLAAGGAWCGLLGLPTILLIGAGAGLVYVLIRGDLDAPLPFAPFLALGIFLTYVTG